MWAGHDGDLKRDGKLLELECSSCHRHLYEDPAKFPFRDAEPETGAPNTGI
jgi:hypothetical protein